ncbi:MAG: energy-coupling factor transporter transmembrane protein EcfT [Syntrophales bacterium]|nr:energy-coupling factor transporter transmembrane protein EcfT [Syntrophales bacterium]
MRALNYRDKDTVIHALSPLAKLAWGGGLLVLSLIFNHPVYILILFLSIIPMVKLAGVGREWASALKFTLWLGLSIIVINALFSYHGDHVLATAPFRLPVVGQPVITLEAIAFGAVMTLKLVVIISVFVLINLTVHPDDIMAVLLKMRLPYKSVLVTSLSTRFVPCLVEDMGRISDGYRTRGVQLDAGSWIKKLKNRAKITIALLSNSLDRAVQVAEAMEARAFGTGQKRVFYKDISLSKTDVVTLGVGLLPLAAGIALRIYGYGDYQYYPNLTSIGFGGWEWLMPAGMLLLLAAIVPLAFIKRRVELD